MKRLIAFLTLAGMLTFGITNVVLAQDEAAGEATTTEVDSTATETDSTAVAVENWLKLLWKLNQKNPKHFIRS